jgi:hypothetical protein
MTARPVGALVSGPGPRFVGGYIVFYRLPAESTAPPPSPAALLEVIKALVLCDPRDPETHGFETFRFLAPRLKSWDEVKAPCQGIGQLLMARAIKGEENAP